jgi:hypothetical protein
MVIPEPVVVRVYADVVMPYEDFLRLDDTGLRDYVTERVQVLDWRKGGPIDWQKEGISDA